MNIYLTISIQNKTQYRNETDRYINQGEGGCAFLSLKTPGTGIKKQLKKKIGGLLKI